MVNNSAIQNLIRDNKTFRISSSIQTGRKLGMQLMDDHIFRLFGDGKISDEDARDHAQSPSSMQEKIDAFRAGTLKPTDLDGPLPETAG